MISTHLFNCSRKGLYRRLNFKPQLWSRSLSLFNMSIIKSVIRAISVGQKSSKEVKDPFEESNRLIDNAKKSYFEMMEEEERAIRESANPSESNL